jgi:dnd system-associated protein 4
MGDARIKVAKDKAELVKALRAGDDTTGPFQSYADVLVFAASLGMQRQSRKPLTEYSKEIDPIRQDIFIGKGYNQVINLISVADTNDPKSVSSSDEAEELRVRIFEEYANSGLDFLLTRLQGHTNYTECILLILDDHVNKQKVNDEEFDLSNFI